MEDNLITWQSIWQKQKAKPMQLNKIISRLNNLEQKAKVQRTTLLALFSILIIAAALRPFELLDQKFNLLAYILILTGVIVKLVPNLKGKYNLIVNEVELDNQKYVKSLEESLKFDAKRLLIFLALVILGLNSALIGLYEKGTIFNFEFTTANRTIFHLSTIILFIIGFIVNNKRMTKRQRGIAALIAELNNN